MDSHYKGNKLYLTRWAKVVAFLFGLFILAGMLFITFASNASGTPWHNNFFALWGSYPAGVYIGRVIFAFFYVIGPALVVIAIFTRKPEPKPGCGCCGDGGCLCDQGQQ